MKDKQFLRALFRVIHRNVFNNYEDNWDQYRFGEKPKVSILSQIRFTFVNAYKYFKYLINSSGVVYLPVKHQGSDGLDPFRFLYYLLKNDKDRNLLLELVAFRILGHTKVKLSTNRPALRDRIEKLDFLCNRSDSFHVKFNNLELMRMNLDPIGIPIDFYYSPYGVYVDFILEQYKYQNQDYILRAKAGDYVIDAGGCWGDTALYFANLVGSSGKVFSYEFIPSNLEIFRKNLGNNPELGMRVSIMPNPVWSVSDLKLNFFDNGPGSRVFFEDEGRIDGSVKTLSIDDMVSRNTIEKIDFIKMDIEGAELSALKGAIQTLRNFKPTLAISIYHNVDDFRQIPEFISNLDLGYKFYLGHYSIHLEETILFATVND